MDRGTFRWEYQFSRWRSRALGVLYKFSPANEALLNAPPTIREQEANMYLSQKVTERRRGKED